MRGKNKILVVGTTADYVDIMIDRFGDRVLFLKDIQEKASEKLSRIDLSVEFFSDCNDHAASLHLLEEHLKRYNIVLSGIVCFDCESLELASVIAEKFSLSFPSLESVLNCRSKFKCKQIWEQNGIPCPSAKLVEDVEDVVAFKEQLSGPAVLKPLTGSGSELVFYCEDIMASRDAFSVIQQKLVAPLNKRMYSLRYMPKEFDPHNVIVMEQFIGGEEYSCDFILENNKASLIRFSRKMFRSDSTFGTVLAYVLPAEFPLGWNRQRLENRLLEASKSLGLDRTIAMVDLKFYNDEFYLIELTPRPGGDCLPQLIQASSGVDIFKITLDFSEGKEILIPSWECWKTVIGMPVISTIAGKLRTIEVSKVLDDVRVISVQLKRNAGDLIRLPPQDYDSRILGNILFAPKQGIELREQCQELLEKCFIRMEEQYVIG